jgi:NAD(P)H-dependent flavin oxidoreductase YrpB (nitropropane dioxygenase family)
VILDERVPVFSIGLGDPGLERVRRCHERGIKVIAMAATVDNAAQDIYTAAATQGDGEHFPQYAGQGLGLIHDLPGAAEVVERIVAEARMAMGRLSEGSGV